MDDDAEFIEGLAALADLDDEEELEELREAASFNTETYRILKDVGFSTIILPKHIRWKILKFLRLVSLDIIFYLNKNV